MDTKQLAGQAYRKYTQGASLSDDEVLAGVEVFKEMFDSLVYFGETYALIRRDMVEKWSAFRSFAVHRGLTIPE